jgi:hypothetical protein
MLPAYTALTYGRLNSARLFQEQRTDQSADGHAEAHTYVEFSGIEDVTSIRAPARGNQPCRALVDFAVPFWLLQRPHLDSYERNARLQTTQHTQQALRAQRGLKKPRIYCTG